MSERPNCPICETQLAVTWTDTHGVGACTTCGLPHVILHYEDKDGRKVRVDRPPESAISDEWMPLAKEYWAETHRRVFPGSYDMGIGHNGRTYSGATPEDCRLFNEWLDAREDRWPKKVDSVDQCPEVKALPAN